MKVSVEWLQTFFDTSLPGSEKLENVLTFHSSEIESVEVIEGDTVLDVKVLPDKSAWMLSHRGIAKELATILNTPLSNDPFSEKLELAPKSDSLDITIDADGCNRYTAAVLHDVQIGPSPEWLQRRLRVLGQRSINNVVDATNYVMFHLGQPLHAFDADKLEKQNEKYSIGIRTARAGEQIVTLSGDEYALTEHDMLIVDRLSDTPIGIAGVKGGKHAEVHQGTTRIILESANFDRISVRKTAQRLKLRTDASSRFENGVVSEVAAHGLVAAARLIVEIAGGVIEGYVDEYPHKRNEKSVSVSVEKINGVLGVALDKHDIDAVFARFGYESRWIDYVITVTPPFERDDLVIPEDLVEEVGRIHGLTHVPTVVPEPMVVKEHNASFYYAEQVRSTLTSLGFSEVFTSSFRQNDKVKLANALASDKHYLRSNLRDNISDALVRNVQNKDLLGLDQIALFEIGTVFQPDTEHMAVAFGVRTGSSYSGKKDDQLVTAAIEALKEVLGFEEFDVRDGIAEVDFTAAISDLPVPSQYAPFQKTTDVEYEPFSLYPSISRDIALWVSEGTSASDVATVLNDAAGELRVRTTLFDEFAKDGKTSYAYRLVFQSKEKTLTDSEVNGIMDAIYLVVGERGWKVR